MDIKLKKTSSVCVYVSNLYFFNTFLLFLIYTITFIVLFLIIFFDKFYEKVFTYKGSLDIQFFSSKMRDI